MFTMIVGAIINIILDPIMIYYLDLGIKGAAIATVLAQAVSALVAITYLKGPKGSIKLRFKYFRINISILTKIITIGIPSFFRQAGASILTIILNNLLGIYGDIYISIYGIILKVTSFTFMPVLGIFQGMAPILGYNYGAKKYQRVLEVTKLAKKWGVMIMAVAMIIIEIFPAIILAIFTTDQELIQTGILFVRIFFISFWIIPLDVLGSTTFQSIGLGRKALFTAMLRQFIILVPVLLTTHSLFGLIGIYMAFPISDFIAANISNFLVQKQLNSLI